MSYKILASPSSWIEGEAVKQMDVSSKLDGMHQVVGMPDLHPGKGFPVGAAFLCDYIYPSLVGSDIGCGMLLSKLEIPFQKIKLSQWAKKLEKIEDIDFKNEHVQTVETICVDCSIENEPALGTVGSGNHFVEIQKVIEIKNPVIAELNGLKVNDVFLVVHTGSRGLGAYILGEYQKKYGFNGLKTSDEQNEYLKKHDQALLWAKANRKILTEMTGLLLDTKTIPLIDIVHNYVEMLNNQFLHRKGAASSEPLVVPTKLGFIPSSRGELSYLVEPLLNPNALNSLPHGAGRKWKRGDCKGKLEAYTAESFKRTKLGSFVICGDKDLLFEEAPQAYKKISQVMLDVETHQLANMVAVTQPLLTYKCPSKI